MQLQPDVFCDRLLDVIPPVMTRYDSHEAGTPVTTICAFYPMILPKLGAIWSVRSTPSFLILRENSTGKQW